jgi:hypothetical protein
MTTAWSRFFCPCCQTERSTEIRVRVANNTPRCTYCVSKSEPLKQKVGRKKRVEIVEEEHDGSVPGFILDAYREAMGD